jgi:uncharacterized Zn ribbon protein
MITKFEIFESSISANGVGGKSYPDHNTPKFKIGDEVMVIYDLKQFGYPYGIVKGDLVNIIDFWINGNGNISYTIDSPKLREIKKGIDIRNDDFDEFNFEYEWKINANKYNI